MSTRLIAVDGLDGCGKDTHARRIREQLEAGGQRVTVISHPSTRLAGRLSRGALKRSGAPARLFATLFFTIDVLVSVRWLKRQKEGVVIFVRYLMGTAYLTDRLAPLGYGFFRRLLPFPDLPLFIDIEPRVAIERIRRRREDHEMFETEKSLSSVRRTALKLASDGWTIVDNNPEGEGPFEQVSQILKERSYL